MFEKKEEFASTITTNTQSLCVSKCLDMKKRNYYNDVNFTSVDKVIKIGKNALPKIINMLRKKKILQKKKAIMIMKLINQ